ncbi:MAG: hypothetical protein AAB505_03050 [Patescibacteria group bacterium]
MIKRSSFSLTVALLGLFVVILPFLGLPTRFKTVGLVFLGGLIILFALAEAGQGKGNYGDEATK